MQTQPSFFDRFNEWLSGSITIKFLLLGFLLLILLIPSGMVESLIYERQSLRDSAILDISSKWGGAQTIGGPVISIPYQITKSDRGETETVTNFAHFLPDQLTINGDLFPEKKYRGIYVVMLYNCKIHIKGTFKNFNVKALNVPAQSLQFDKAMVSVGITDMKGIRENIFLRWNDHTLQFGPGISTSDIFKSGVSVPVHFSADSTYEFEFDIEVNGSERIRFLPFGNETFVSLKGNWGDPSFEGSFLPAQKNISENRFEASWKVLQLNRNYQQQGVGAFLPAETANFDPIYQKESEDPRGAFGVKLLIPVDEYQKTMRSSKYAVMFICLTFLTLFFTEILNKKLIHPIQYMLMGFAIVLFYVLLLSISEHLKFDISYLIAGLSTLSLVSFYAWSMLRNIKLSMVVSGVVAVLYLFFYSLLQLEQYALLLGSVGLLLILATVMYLTRNVNWYDLRKKD
jgi:inner membrane protein